MLTARIEPVEHTRSVRELERMLSKTEIYTSDEVRTLRYFLKLAHTARVVSTHR